MEFVARKREAVMGGPGGSYDAAYSKIAVLVERRYLKQVMPGALVGALGARGVRCDVISPEGSRFHPESGVVRSETGTAFDLNEYAGVVSRNRNTLGLAMLSYAENAGIPTINSAAATYRVRNKAEMAVGLGRAGIRCAPTVLAGEVSGLAKLPREYFPVLLKPIYGDNGHGLRLVRDVRELSSIHWPEELVLAQQYLPNAGFDLKLYVCGGTVFAMRKPSPLNTDPTAPTEPVEADAATVDLALRCGEIFGLHIYGVDAIETEEGPVVIELNEFPNFTGVPGAGDCLADHVLAHIELHQAA
jgi:ribosomal protein S6--L-glutamate ligase